MFPVKNKIHIPSKDFVGYGFYLSFNCILLTVRRFNTENGWDNLTAYIDDEEFILSPSTVSHKNYVLNTKNKLEKVDLEYPQKIPKIIVQTNNQKNNEYNQKQLYDTLIELNPEYKYMFFDDTQRRKFIKEFFTPNVLLAYDTLVPGAFKADLFRYCFIYLFGGCYLDYKTICLKPLREFIKENDDYLICLDYEKTNSKDIKICNSFLNSVLISEPKNPIFWDLIVNCVENILTKQQEFVNSNLNRVLDLTGPTFMYKVCKDKIDDNHNHLRLKYFINGNGNQYSDLQIVDLHTEKTLCYKTDIKSNIKNHSDNNHYGKLWERGELFYDYKGLVCKNINEYFSLFVYPNNNNNFYFSIDNDDLVLGIINPDIKWDTLKVKLINEQTNVSNILILSYFYI